MNLTKERLMSLARIAALTCLTGMFASCSGDADPTEEAALIWVNSNAMPLASAEPDADETDLAFFARAIGAARIVSMGEASHATREHFTMKDRLIRHGVTSLGVRAIGFELEYSETLMLNDYVMGLVNLTDPELVPFMGYLAFEETIDLLKWLRQHNATLDEAARVQVFGFDMQAKEAAIERVLAYVAAVDPASEAAFRAAYDPYRAIETRDYASQPRNAQDGFRTQLTDAVKMLNDRRALYTERSSVREFAEALRCAELLLQQEELSRQPLELAKDDQNIREKHMAANIVWMHDRIGVGQRMFLWAHNGHVFTRDDSPKGGTKWMGSILRDRYKANMVVVGLTSYSGTHESVRMLGDVLDVSVGPLPAAKAGSYEEFFSRARSAQFALDLRKVPASSWLRQARPMRFMPGFYDAQKDDTYFELTDLTGEFDLVIHFNTISPATRSPTL